VRRCAGERERCAEDVGGRVEREECEERGEERGVPDMAAIWWVYA
jgi:hypothetical protein